MILGACQFDARRAQLKNLTTGDEWLLPRAELQVLKLLLASRGSVVAKHRLGAADDDHPALTDSSVTRAVFMLRSFLGPEHEHLIETVKGRGYRLRSETRRRRRERWLTLTWGKPRLTLVILLPFIVLTAFYFSESYTGSEPTAPLKSVSISLPSGQELSLISYSKSKTNNESLLLLIQQLEMGFKQCISTSWQQVYLSLSHDKQIFNITMKGEKLGQSVIRNLKLSDFRQQKQFISQTWLDEVALCE
ncbi:winged helix-turn-helix domain-containing protein [Shewanella nanhaiensis]|uniref:Helix-turn-helix domain-containing protein n=1 Tax=Shewanella nanhaiensis TaxID=2864872 RepID=A0ABS7E012_9GAMM|nr:helix-turn-helix domain-containing protein [Shewanella nanhaiensis]MBW8183011.1 helix-turn-helix domain-containing protein [Shewanella nanhaiensis]